MTTEVLTFRPDDNVGDAMSSLVARSIDAAPVVDDAGSVVGMLSTGDLIVQETTLHVPTILSLFGATLELPSSKRHFEEDLRRALGSTVADVMTPEPVTIGSDATVEDAATSMHDEKVSRLPVVDGGQLVGIVSRTDILRAILSDDAAPAEG
ncbi:MAG: CBS domain-containing protein [Acidimicrobiales bacterium]|nr:CBS domain-containing protein [Acidimicrobiales bacterium]HRW37768.1 CBS domain-containing protein [Aquihabitans sp.]